MFDLKTQLLAAGLCLFAFFSGEADAQSVISVTVSEDGMSAAPQKVTRGKITLRVTNTSSRSGRQIIVLPMKDDGRELLLRADRKEDLDYADDAVGRITNLVPKSTGVATMDLRSGTYIVTSNSRGPYLNGMWTAFEVK